MEYLFWSFISLSHTLIDPACGLAEALQCICIAIAWCPGDRNPNVVTFCQHMICGTQPNVSTGCGESLTIWGGNNFKIVFKLFKYIQVAFCLSKWVPHGLPFFFINKMGPSGGSKLAAFVLPQLHCAKATASQQALKRSAESQPRCTMHRDRHVHLYTVYTCLYICYVRHIMHNIPCHAISYHVLHYIILQLNCIALHCVRTYVEYV